NPTHVTKAIGTNMGITGVELRWNASTDNRWLSHYLVYRDGVEIDTVSKGNYYFDHSDGPNGISAHYQVQAVDGDGNVSQKSEAVNNAGEAVLYTAQGGFLSGKDYSYQGANNWFYEEWTGSHHTPMVWDGALGQMGLYRGVDGPGSSKPEIGASWMQPGVVSDAVRIFSLPYTGQITISGRPHKDLYHTYGDGVRLKILKNDTQIWPANGWQTIAAKDIVGRSFELTTSVHRGDKLYFIMNRNSDPADDETVWNPNIVYGRIEDDLSRAARTVIDDDSSRLQYQGGGWQKQGLNPWSSDVDQGYLPGWANGTLSVSGTAGDILKIKFRGTGLEIIGQ